MSTARAGSCARSTDTPRASPVDGSFAARTGFPKLIAARSFPVGARSETAAEGAAGIVEQAARPAARQPAMASLNMAVMCRIVGVSARSSGPLRRDCAIDSGIAAPGASRTAFIGGNRAHRQHALDRRDRLDDGGLDGAVDVDQGER